MTTLQDWMNANVARIPQDALYKSKGVSQMCFVRDHLAPLVAYKHRAEVVDDEDFEAQGVKLPVYHLAQPTLEVTLSCDFKEWKLHVKSAVTMKIPEWLLDMSTEHTYQRRSREFIMTLPTEYQVFALVAWLFSGD